MPEFTEHFMELMTDPAHLAFEVATSLIFALIAQVAAWPVIARRIRREHATIDAEHGLVDHEVPEVEPEMDPNPDLGQPTFPYPQWGAGSEVQPMLLGADGHRCHSSPAPAFSHTLMCPTGEHFAGWQHMAGGEHRSMFPCCLIPIPRPGPLDVKPGTLDVRNS